MITTETPRGRWITLRNGNRAIAFAYETDAEAQARYDRIEANRAEITFGYGDAEVPTVVEAQPEGRPFKSIRFDGRTCRRCEGEGRSAHWTSYTNNGTCYSCRGAGSFLSEAGREARDAYDAAIREAFWVRFGDLKVGERFAVAADRHARWMEIRNEGDLTALPAEQRVRREMPKGTKNRIMREIAERYPSGAKLIY